jgi:DNA-binding response OmpR family regulator
MPARLRVLLIDDEPHLLYALARGLEPEFEVVACPTSADGARALGAASAFDVLVIDIVMPNPTGADLYESLSEEDQERVIFITAGPFIPELQTFVERVRGRATILEKPFRLADLRTVIRSVARVDE